MATTGSEDVVSVADLERQARNNYGEVERAPYITHQELLAKGRTRPPATIQPTVSAFAEWVFGLTNSDDLNAKERGRASEFVVVRDKLMTRMEFALRKEAARKTNLEYYTMKRFPKHEWEVIFNGTSEVAAEPLAISVLKVNGQPLKGKPDIVFRHKSTENILIVELKSWGGQGRLPPFGWPNLKVQLWCYGLIDLWREAPKVFLQGWVWRWDTRPDAYDGPGIQLPGIVLQPWLASDPRVHKESVELFSAFGGYYMP